MKTKFRKTLEFDPQTQRRIQRVMKKFGATSEIETIRRSLTLTEAVMSTKRVRGCTVIVA